MDLTRPTTPVVLEYLDEVCVARGKQWHVPQALRIRVMNRTSKTTATIAVHPLACLEAAGLALCETPPHGGPGAQPVSAARLQP
jgi:hypothetical protein